MSGIEKILLSSTNVTNRITFTYQTTFGWYILTYLKVKEICDFRAILYTCHFWLDNTEVVSIHPLWGLLYTYSDIPFTGSGTYYENECLVTVFQIKFEFSFVIVTGTYPWWHSIQVSAKQTIVKNFSQTNFDNIRHLFVSSNSGIAKSWYIKSLFFSTHEPEISRWVSSVDDGVRPGGDSFLSQVKGVWRASCKRENMHANSR